MNSYTYKSFLHLSIIIATFLLFLPYASLCQFNCGSLLWESNTFMFFFPEPGVKMKEITGTNLINSMVFKYLWHSKYFKILSPTVWVALSNPNIPCNSLSLTLYTTKELAGLSWIHLSYVILCQQILANNFFQTFNQGIQVHHYDYLHEQPSKWS